MNVENIASLSFVLSQAGLDQLAYPLLQHICCRPAHFTLVQEIVIGSGRLQCSVYVERSSTDYRLVYYDASLIKDVAVPDLVIGQISLRELETSMQAIDWRVNKAPAVFRLDDAGSYAREIEIDRIVRELMQLSATPEGKVFADGLKVKFWSGTFIEELQGSLAAIRSKLEVSQRFYFMQGEVIAVQEAYRFLQNRWMEKVIAAKRKEESGEKSGGVPLGKGGEKPGAMVKKRIVHKRRKIS